MGPSYFWKRKAQAIFISRSKKKSYNMTVKMRAPMNGQRDKNQSVAFKQKLLQIHLLLVGFPWRDALRTRLSFQIAICVVIWFNHRC